VPDRFPGGVAAFQVVVSKPTRSAEVANSSETIIAWGYERRVNENLTSEWAREIDQTIQYGIYLRMPQETGSSAKEFRGLLPIHANGEQW